LAEEEKEKNSVKPSVARGVGESLVHLGLADGGCGLLCIPKTDVKPSLIWAVYIALTRRKRLEFSFPLANSQTWISVETQTSLDGLKMSKLFSTAW
jgi:hypothetical protein